MCSSFCFEISSVHMLKSKIVFVIEKCFYSCGVKRLFYGQEGKKFGLGFYISIIFPFFFEFKKPHGRKTIFKKG